MMHDSDLNIRQEDLIEAIREVMSSDNHESTSTIQYIESTHTVIVRSSLSRY